MRRYICSKSKKCKVITCSHHKPRSIEECGRKLKCPCDTEGVGYIAAPLKVHQANTKCGTIKKYLVIGVMLRTTTDNTRVTCKSCARLKKKA